MDKERLFLLDAILQADSGRVKTKNKEENTHDYLQKHRVPVAADGGGGDPAAGRGRGEEAGDGAGAEGCGEEKGTVGEMKEAWIRLECNDGLVEINVGGKLSELMVMAVMAVSTASKYIYDKMVEDGRKRLAEETVHDIQKMLEPTGKVWYSETLGGIMLETEHN